MHKPVFLLTLLILSFSSSAQIRNNPNLSKQKFNPTADAPRFLDGSSFPGEGTDFHARRQGVAGVQSDTIPPTWAQHYAEGSGRSDDLPSGIAVDEIGNVYVTGQTDNQPWGPDYAVIKYSQNGDMVWTSLFDGGTLSEDLATGIAVDHQGNVYVTGYTFLSSFDSDVLTVKYNSSGDQQWVAEYSDSGLDWHTKIAVDSDGFPYVTFTSIADSYDRESIVTIKYDPTGLELWKRELEVEHNGSNYPKSIKVDGRGNVYVAASYDTMDGINQFATLKYDRDGNEMWVALYGSVAEPSDLALDNLGNVYVTGWSYGEGIPTDFVTLKYDSSGNLVWETRYDSPAHLSDEALALTLDERNNVYVVGQSTLSYPNWDYVTVKYDSLGIERWVARYDGPANDQDRPTAVGIDNAGYLLVTGESKGIGSGYDLTTVQYDTAGTEVRVSRFDDEGHCDETAIGLGVAPSGRASILGIGCGIDGDRGFRVVTYDPVGTEIWATRFDGTGSAVNNLTAMTVDPEGNVIVTGESLTPEFYGYDYVTIKYAPDGTQQWKAAYNGPGDFFDTPSAITNDGNGNTYVTGESVGSDGHFDFLTVKYDRWGTELWTARYNGEGNNYDQANEIEVDPEGNVYVTGTSIGIGTGYDIATVKYDPAGTVIWVARYTSSYSVNDIGLDLAVDNSGNVYVVGTTTDYVTIKYDPAGNLSWIDVYEEGDVGAALDVELDEQGNPYVTGAIYTEAELGDAVTIAYDPSGNRRWVSRYVGQDHLDDSAAELVLGPSGNLYITGATASEDTRRDFLTISYDPNGNQRWVAIYNGPSDSFEQAVSIDVGDDETIYVVGSSGYAFTAIAYSSLGTQQLVAQYRVTPTTLCYPTVVRVGAMNNIYVGGITTGHNYGVDTYTTFMYEGVALSTEEPDGGYSSSFTLLQNYPNPFNPRTNISFSLPGSGRVSLKIFNLLGEEVATLVSGQRDAGAHSVQWDATGQPSGVYFYRLSTNGFVQTRKLVLLR